MVFERKKNYHLKLQELLFYLHQNPGPVSRKNKLSNLTKLNYYDWT